MKKYFFFTVARLLIEYDVARGILKFLSKTWEFHATSYSVNSQAIIPYQVPFDSNKKYSDLSFAVF